MYVYVFQTDLLCDACGEALAAEMSAAGVDDTGDSDDYPQGPMSDGGGEADSPHHCGRGADCVNAEEIGDRVVGAFLENPLTEEGVGYVTQQSQRCPHSAIVGLWAEYYGIDREAA